MALSRMIPIALSILVCLPGLSMSDARADDSSLRLKLDTNSLGFSVPVGTTAVQESGSTSESIHPPWVLDFESAMWPGFLTGMSGYDDFINPIGSPLYFEHPFIRSEMRLLYIYHTIPKKSALRGGQIHVVAVQLSLALSERWAFLAVKDGYTWYDTHITPAGEGWNDITIGLKYALHVDPENKLLVSAGLRWEWSNGSTQALQGGSQELSPFVSMAKGWDKWHFLGTLSGRIPLNRNRANASVLWSLHLDYAITDTFRPVVEVHGTHWVSNADQLPLSVDYLDVGSFGASKVSGRDLFIAGLGFRWKASPAVSVGLMWEFPLEGTSEHLFEQRVTFNTVVRF